jgi:hypothetical protein
MRKALLLLATLAGSISWLSTYATIITIDLGSPQVTGEEFVSFSGLNDLQFNGQTLSLDLVFSGNSFVRLFKSTSSTFLLLPMLDVFGAGTINNPTGSGYLFDEAGHPISSVTSFGGSVTTEAFRLSLGGFFPLLAEKNALFPLDIYGAHFDITMPNSWAFDVIGGELGLFPNTLQSWHDQFQTGDLADSGSTALVGLIAIALLFGLDAAMPCRIAGSRWRRLKRVRLFPRPPGIPLIAVASMSESESSG